jgi:hypothetical protein
MGPTYKIAELLKISPIAATAYCEKVRLLSGLGPRLQYKTIMTLLVQHTDEASPEKMAKLIGARKLSTASQTKINPKKMVSPFHAVIPNKRIQQKKRKGRKNRRFEELKPTPPPSYLVRTSYLDNERVSEQKLDHCPHGVPYGRVCAICDPRKFREMTGMD